MSKISLITTVLNEASTLEQFLNSVLKQTRKPDEFIIVDGGSKDNTVELIRTFARKHKTTKLLIKPGITIGAARNLAIKMAKHEIIASTDAGSIAGEDWLKELTRPFTNALVEVSVGAYKPHSTNDFEYFQGKVIVPKVNDIFMKPGRMSTRSLAFRKNVWEKIGGFAPEFGGKIGGEDTLFATTLAQGDFRITFAPKAIVYWKMRPTLKGFFSQFYRYASGDNKIGNLMRLPQNLALVIGFWAWLAVLVISTIFWQPMALFLIGLLTLYLIIVAVIGLLKTKRIAALFYFPLFSVTKRLAYVLGATLG